MPDAPVNSTIQLRPDPELAWKLFVELRREILAQQRIRSQILALKITALGAGVALIIANIDRVPDSILAIPAFAAVFFDVLITSYSVSIKRIGYYCRTVIEPVFKWSGWWSPILPLWEEYMSQPRVRQSFSLIGNFGLTLVTVVPAVYGLLTLSPVYSVATLALLAAFLFIDFVAYLRPRWIVERGLPNGGSGQGAFNWRGSAS